MRLRFRYTTWPRPALELTDTPQPNCCVCNGAGGYQTGTPYDEEPDEVVCGCWRPERAWFLAAVPAWIARRWLGWTEPAWSEEAPF
jgi:hypothetical protein